MQITPNLGLKQPSQTDFYDVQDFNDNMQLIDDALGEAGVLFSKIYPVGSIYMSVNDVDPAVLFGGTWEKLPAGRCLIGAGSFKPTISGDVSKNYSLNDMGGRRYCTLTSNNLPGHSHSGWTRSGDGAHTHIIDLAVDTPSPPGDRNNSVVCGDYMLTDLGRTKWNKQTIIKSDTFMNGNNNLPVTRSTDGAHEHYITVSSYSNASSFETTSPYLVVNMWKRTA